ncbi:MAG TPA: NADH-quinone oxidoreductase subunit C [Lentimicrobium sp.]|nr:NADH-quinone oxidoreductase subunit C [Lentimicrobium sp.]
MTNDSLIQKLSAMLPDGQVKMGFEFVEALVPREQLRDFFMKIKNTPELAFDYMICLTGADFADHLQVIYHMESTVNNHMMVVKVKTADRENAVIETVSDIYPTAEPHENEVFDLLGIKFNNHPEPRRLFLEDDWGYPLRKDFRDDVHVVTR